MIGKNVHDNIGVWPNYVRLMFVNNIHDNINVCPLCVYDYKNKRTLTW